MIWQQMTVLMLKYKAQTIYKTGVPCLLLLNPRQRQSGQVLQTEISVTAQTAVSLKTMYDQKV